MKKRLCAALLGVCLLLTAGACSPQREKMTDSIEAMDTFMTLEVYGVSGNELSSIRANIEALDKRLSVTNDKGEDNEIFRVNQNGEGAVSPDVAELAEQSLALCEDTGGALDITVLPVVEEWGFISKDFQIPTAERLTALLPLVDHTQVSCENNIIKLKRSGMKLDFGAVAKGYAADRALFAGRAYRRLAAALQFQHRAERKTEIRRTISGVGYMDAVIFLQHFITFPEYGLPIYTEHGESITVGKVFGYRNRIADIFFNLRKSGKTGVFRRFGHLMGTGKAGNSPDCEG